MDIIVTPLMLKDWNWVNDYAQREAALNIPYLRFDDDRAKAIFTDAVSGASSLAVKAERNGKPVGALISLTMPNVWAGKQCSNVILWVSNLTPAGVKLLKHYRQWLNTRPAIRVAGFQPAFELNERTQQLIQLCGFPKSGGAFLYTAGIQ